MTDLNNLSAFNRVVDSVRLPIEHFVKTGFWNPNVLPDRKSEDISDQQVRRACRTVAKEMKRPFIVCHPTVQWSYRDPDTGLMVEYPEPRVVGGFIEVPRRKYLHGHVATLLLAGNSKLIRHVQQATLWAFRIYDVTLWNEYYDFVLNDPECRAARKLTS